MPPTKTEESLKNIITEYMEEKNARLLSDIDNRYLGIFAFGVMSGALLAYSNLLPIIIGILTGYAIAKKEIHIIDHGIVWLSKSVKIF